MRVSLMRGMNLIDESHLWEITLSVTDQKACFPASPIPDHNELL